MSIPPFSPASPFPISLVEVLDNLEGIGVYMVDRDRRIVFWNKAAEQITGWGRREVEQTRCHDGILCHVDRHGRQLCDSTVCPLFLSMARNADHSLHTFVYARRKDGKRVPVAVSVSPIRSGKGEVVGGMEVFRDASREVFALETAQMVQRQLLPDPETLEGVGPVAFAYLPAEMLGGDFVQVFPAPGGKVAGLIADVSGHGSSSALITSFIRSSLLPLEGTVDSPAVLLTHLARSYKVMESLPHYFSAQAFVLDRATGRVKISSAGHPQPILLGQDGSATVLAVEGDLIGLFEGAAYTDTAFELQGGRLILYSDGLTEAPNPARERLGLEGFLAFCRETTGLPRRACAQALVRKVFDYTHAFDPEDDLTVLVIDGP